MSQFKVGDQLLHGDMRPQVVTIKEVDGDLLSVVSGSGHEFYTSAKNVIPMGSVSTVEPPKPAVQDPINHPKHYTSHPSGVECITITEHMSFLLGNAMKYIWRADLKNGVEDLKKAVWYVEREIAKRLSALESKDPKT